MYQINLFKNYKTPSNPITINLDKYVEYLKDGFNKEKVLKGRQYKKGEPLYEREKEASPCVNFNFLFDNYRSDKNIVTSTGLLYYDFDSADAITSLSKIDKNKILLLNKSFGGNGYSMVVKANGITKENFKLSYDSIANELGIDNLFDASAVKKIQPTVLSFDSDAIYNPDSIVFNATNPEKVSFSSNMSFSLNFPRNNTFFNDYSNSFRITNASDYVNENNLYQVFPEGISVAKIDIPRNISNGNRKNTLLAIANQIITINPLINYDEVLTRLLSINIIITNEPLSYHEVSGIVKSLFKYKAEGTLKPINNKIRKVIFNENCGLTKEDKISIVNKEVGKMRTETTKKKIYDAIINWNQPEKITAKTIALKINMGIATVKKHWSGFKTIVIEFNNKIKNTN